MAGKKKTPQIRINGFTKDWNVGLLNQYLETSLEKNCDEVFSREDVLSVSGDYGVVNQIEFQGRSFAGASVANYGVVHTGDVVYTKSPLKENPYGIIKTNTGKPGIVSTLYAIYHPLETTYPEFVQWYFENNDRLNRYLNPLVNKGAKNDMKVSSDNALLGNVVFPEYDEQKAISDALVRIKTIILQYEAKLQKLQTLKASMLEKMFPRNGSCYPEIRFKGFTAPWEQRKLGDIFEEYSEKGHPELPALTIIQGGGTIRRDESDRSLQYDKASLASYKMVNDGDFIVHLRSFEGGLEKATTLGIISPAYHTFHGEGTDSRFYYSYFRSPKFIDQDLKPHVYGIRDGRSIDIEGMKTIEIPWTSFAEQKDIGDYIDTLDNLITLHQRELEKLQSIKKALLEKMFV